MQRLQANVQQFRRLSLVVPCLVESAQDHLSLDLVQRSSDGKGNGVLCAQPPSLFEWIRGKVVTFNLLSRTDHYGALDHIAQLAHIAWPRMKTQRIQRGRADETRWSIVLGSQSSDQMLGQQRQVFHPLG